MFIFVLVQNAIFFHTLFLPKIYMFCLIYYLPTAPKDLLATSKIAYDSVMVISNQKGAYSTVRI